MDARPPTWPVLAYMREEISRFADFAALAYHEARNVRHLAGRVNPDDYTRLVSLVKNRQEAWRQMQPLRRKAAEAVTAALAEAVYQKQFGVSLLDLAELLRHPGWKHSATRYGGNAWAAIDEAIIELRDAIDAGRSGQASECIQRLQGMPHNTGCVGEKLAALDAGLVGPKA